jgi:hypothetical protein
MNGYEDLFIKDIEIVRSGMGGTHRVLTPDVASSNFPENMRK